MIDDLGYDAAGILFFDAREEVLSLGALRAREQRRERVAARSEAHAPQRARLPRSACARARSQILSASAPARARGARCAAG